ncbi:hypothetical protein RIF29_15058 [Crotalaria pallida]|uniref:ascorbate ferrireductase (transmembrane) n=1 Tax=Crotalaria pallida TaxID=3830 RepID=A0AAN9FCW9_CROPI
MIASHPLLAMVGFLFHLVGIILAIVVPVAFSLLRLQFSTQAMNWMPVILGDKDSTDVWLGSSASSYKNVLKPYEESDLVWYPMTPGMGKPSFDGPECIKEVTSLQIGNYCDVQYVKMYNIFMGQLQGIAKMPRGFQIRATPVTMLAHLSFIATTSLVLVWLLRFREGLAFNSSNKIKIFNLHPLLTVIGFVLVDGEAIVTYKSIPGKQMSVKVVHLLLHLIALASGILGITAVFKFKKEAGLPNMYTLHSWLGISAISSFGLQYILGFFTYLFPGAEMHTRATLLPWHRFIGMAIFLLAVHTAETGLIQYFQFLGLFRSQEALIVNFTGLLLFLFAVFVGLSVILPRNY